MTLPATSTPASVLRYLPLTGLAGAPRAAGASTASAATPVLRTATLDGLPYLICPVVAVVGDIVWRPMGSEGPEYVPSTVLADFPSQWNGRPVVLNHPGNGLATANDPTVVESATFGVIFAARFERGALQMDAWISRARAEKVGPKAVTLYNLIEAGETVSVSIGAYAAVMRRDGVSPSGVRYEWEWVALIASDHLAMLEDGVPGACSTEVGCGTPRAVAAAMAAATPEIRVSLRAAAEILGVPEPETLNIEGAIMPDIETPPAVAAAAVEAPAVTPRRAGLMDRLFSAFRPRNAEPSDDGVSDVDLRNILWPALQDSEPGFSWLDRVIPETSTVVYATTLASGETLWWMRTYTLTENGTMVILNDDRVQVEPVLRYEPIAAATSTNAESTPATPISAENHGNPSAVVASTPCGCHNHDDAKGETTMPDNPTPAAAAAGAATPAQATPTAQPVNAAAGAPADAPAAAASVVPANTVSIDAGELANLRRMAAREAARETEQRTTLISALGTAQTAFTAEELTALDTPVLEKMARVAGLDQPVAGPVDYTGVRVASVAAAGEYDYSKPLDSWGINKPPAAN